MTQIVEHRDVALPDLDGRVRDGILVVIPAYNEGENVGAVVSRVPDRVCGLATTVLDLVYPLLDPRITYKPR